MGRERLKIEKMVKVAPGGIAKQGTKIASYSNV